MEMQITNWISSELLNSMQSLKVILISKMNILCILWNKIYQINILYDALD